MKEIQLGWTRLDVEAPQTPSGSPRSTASDRRNHSEVFEITGNPGSKGGESLTTLRGAVSNALAP